MGQIFADAALDALKLLPFLLLLYILIELLEHETAVGKPNRALSGKLAPVIGSATGLIPMCGFSVMAAKLYERRHITLGALFSVFISTSDEAFLVLALSSLPILEKLYAILALCGCKFVLGAGVGMLLDAVLQRGNGGARLASLPEETEVFAREHMHEHEEEEEHDHVHEHAHEGEGEGEFTVCEHKHGSNLVRYLYSPLLHALEVAAVLFVFNTFFGLLFEWIGQDRVMGFLQGSGLWYQPLVSSLVGLVPNCASSVALAEGFSSHIITFGSLLGGLVTNAGFGVVVLFRNGRAWRRNLIILLGTFLLGVLFGYAAQAIEILI